MFVRLSTCVQRSKGTALWSLGLALLAAVELTAPLSAASQDGAGSVRGTVLDRDFEAPLQGATVLVVETGAQAETSSQGTYLLSELPAGTYTLVFSKDGYVRQVSTVAVGAGALTEADTALKGDFTEMEEFIVQDVLQLGGGAELVLLGLRFESSSLMDSIGSELMSRAGASDAASALRLVPGATVKDGKSAVIRGLPDRYISSQLNGVRLPSADAEKRAVDLDQFPSAAIESIQVSKTFTPDQQGDASGGAVNVVLKGVPDESILQFKAQVSSNTNVYGRDDFLTYAGGGVDAFGVNAGNDVQGENIGGDWDGAVGTSRGSAPAQYKLGAAMGGSRDLDSDWRIGGFLGLFYERDSSFYDNGINDSYWIDGGPGTPLTPEAKQGSVGDGDFKTALFDVTKGSESVRWGGLATFGVTSELNTIGLSYLYSRTADDTATLAVDTRGKEYYVKDVLGQPDYDPNDPMDPGHNTNNIDAAPYLRSQTLTYTERWTGSLQLSGQHSLGRDELGEAAGASFGPPELEWSAALSSANLNQPDSRQFGTLWKPASFKPGIPGIIPDITTDPVYAPFKPGANINFGNLQRVFRRIEENSEQLALELRFPFERGQGMDGFIEFGAYDDSVERKYDQDTFTNPGDSGDEFVAGFDEFWSDAWPDEIDHAIIASDTDVDYDGQQDIFAWYGMVDFPLDDHWSLIGGARFESTQIGIQNLPEADVFWVPPGKDALEVLTPGAADVDFQRDDILPALALVWEPSDRWTLRGSWSQTIARQTFRELTPIIQQEFVGGPIFIGNPNLGMSSLENWDLRADFRPYEGGLLSASWFYKDIDDAIELIQDLSPNGFSFTTPVNYPKGTLSGFEFEARQDLGRYDRDLNGLTVGANATFIESNVILPSEDAAEFADLGFPTEQRDLLSAPEYLYNLFLTYDVEGHGTQIGLFYTVQGDTLVAGAGISNNNYVPDVYAKQVGTLNLSLQQPISKSGVLRIQLKNLTDPAIQEVYRSQYIEGEQVKTSYTRGIEVSLGLSFSF
ncbi:catecholate siderophore receptor CirA [Planctomycetes bacterium Pla86]|uniref:Catecholate siderophore receptor CirA n=1 Tax=Engelhardtia mirabilis TaxID=2528011 RepID=A0A518BGH0_9BACT|nr:catecholate siderophore receptor CirA [Planctomycetes bacterium Pla133]QDV00414.1 catecholate siderophore receptor CirA [Planctomycetes bacterium Pla86]